MKTIIISVTNDLVTDQRVHKVSATLFNRDNKVVLVGRLLKNSLPVQRPYFTVRMSLLFTKGPLFYAEYNFRLFLYLLFQPLDILVSNDLDTLPANYLVSVFRRKTLVYDTHEYYTGVPELMNRPFVRSIWETIEKFIFPKLKYIFTVNESIAKLYSDKYHKDIIVVRNISPSITCNTWPERSALGLPADKKIVLLQGSGINVDRGAEELTRAMQYIDNTILLIIGGGDVIEELHKIVKNNNLTEKVIFRPKMSYLDLAGYTRLADLGCTLDKDTNINYRYSLPNKLFDYIHSGIPVLCSNIIEVAKIVKEYKIGEVIDSHDPKLIARKIREMLADNEQIKNWRENLKKASMELCWENEVKELMKVYGKLL